MIKIVAFSVVLFSAIGVYGEGSEAPDGRQKRLLFYDEDGNLVKAQFNPYLQNLGIKAGQLPYYGRFINPFLGFLKELGNSLAAITVPVSNQVVQHIKNDPNYQNILMMGPRKEPVVVPNPLCRGLRTQIPSPQLCNNYLNCWDGWAVEQECPSGLLFSNQGYCDYSDNVNCESRKLNPQPPTEPRCNKDFESFRNQKNCNEFFVCVSREPVRFKCPADLAYNQMLGVCDYLTRVDCGASPILNPILSDLPVTQPTIPELPVTTPSLPASTSILPEITTPNLPVTTPNLPVTTPNLPVSTPELPVSTPDLPVSTPALPVTTPAIPVNIPTLKPPVIKTFITGNSIVNTQSWSSTLVAMSRQDAIRQLQVGNGGNVDIRLR